ncbi:DNA-(apurinic or apyrimidinic site) endonuclease 2-like [Xyrauchen texanus]|uniref:DNA-(apurinic or apyrimidinic site) endonuclease 2-like n=1 Tax=Xyrauchen texanus TaxID=154827 RepID=UPI002241C164|nr:DNA-(apurinic or apyrimidinic site) endonuclease 2-like [Xyrauchen texanus]
MLISSASKRLVTHSGTPFLAEEGLTGLLTSHEGAIGCYGDQVEFSSEELMALDNEGRAVITQHHFMYVKDRPEKLTVINVYCPLADPDKPERKRYKLQFYRLLQIRAEAVLSSGSHVIVLGDVNTPHQPIDHLDVMPEVEGSDHCSVWAQLICTLLPSPKCTRQMPEFTCRQQKYRGKMLRRTDKETDKLADKNNVKIRMKWKKNLHHYICQRTVIKGLSCGFWKSVLDGPPQPPLCKSQNEPCVLRLRAVKKAGPNLGRQFFVCARPQDNASNPQARCNFFCLC